MSLALISLLALGFLEDAAPPFVAHEWGTFTSVSGSDGVMLDWRPLIGADELPKNRGAYLTVGSSRLSSRTRPSSGSFSGGTNLRSLETRTVSMTTG
jgi:hypothetical protein